MSLDAFSARSSPTPQTLTMKTLILGAANILLAHALYAQTEAWQRMFQVPSAPGFTRMAFDAARGVVVGFPAYGTTQTWTYNGTSWQLRPTTQAPPNRIGFCLEYDPVRQRVLLYGGAGYTDTWEWDGASWTQVGFLTDGRSYPGMAFDPVRQQMIRFGGTAAGGYNGETRAWTGTDWILISTGGPPPRYRLAMATDSIRHKVILFGGRGSIGGSSVRFNDTWEWDGFAWLQRFPTFTPPGIDAHSAVFHSAKGWVVIGFGEMAGSGGPTDNPDLYAWNGFDWSRRPLVSHPSTYPFYPLAYDSLRQRIVAVSNSQTWEYTAPPGIPGSFQTMGVGCQGTGGVPSLSAATGEVPYIGYPLHVNLSNLGVSSTVIPFGVAGFSATHWGTVPLPADLGPLGFPGCTAYIDPVVPIMLLNQGGATEWIVQIPNRLDLVSLPLYLQGLVLDGGSLGGAIVTNAATAVIGRR